MLRSPIGTGNSTVDASQAALSKSHHEPRQVQQPWHFKSARLILQDPAGMVLGGNDDAPTVV